MNLINEWISRLQTAEFYSEHVWPSVISIILALLIFIIGRFVAKRIVKVSKKLMKKSNMDDLLVNFLGSIMSGILLLFIIIASLNQLGVDTTSLIALVGAAGLAIGLALQNSLANFAAGVMMIIFKPFKVGDFVEAAGTSGIVENIQIFNTTFRSPDNKELIVPNGLIFGDTITNYSARATRRIDLVIGIAYDADIKQAKTIMEEIIAADERIVNEPAPTLGVLELGDNSVNLYLRPWVSTADYWGVHADVLESVKYRFDEAGIGIPFPQMDVHLHKEN